MGQILFTEPTAQPEAPTRQEELARGVDLSPDPLGQDLSSFTFSPGGTLGREFLLDTQGRDFRHSTYRAADFEFEPFTLGDLDTGAFDPAPIQESPPTQTPSLLSDPPAMLNDTATLGESLRVLTGGVPLPQTTEIFLPDGTTVRVSDLNPDRNLTPEQIAEALASRIGAPSARALLDQLGEAEPEWRSPSTTQPDPTNPLPTQPTEDTLSPVTPPQTEVLNIDDLIRRLASGESFAPGTSFRYPDGRTGALVGSPEGGASSNQVTADTLARALGFRSAGDYLARNPEPVGSQPVADISPELAARPSQPELASVLQPTPQPTLAEALQQDETRLRRGSILRDPTTISAPTPNPTTSTIDIVEKQARDPNTVFSEIVAKRPEGETSATIDFAPKTTQERTGADTIDIAAKRPEGVEASTIDFAPKQNNELPSLFEERPTTGSNLEFSDTFRIPAGSLLNVGDPDPSN